MKANSSTTPVPKVPTDANRHIPRGVTDGDTILATVDVVMPPERVFRALTTNEIERWWGSAETYRIRNWTAELRIGGQWKLNVCLPDGKVLPSGGEFMEIVEPNKLVQTRRYDFDYPILGRRVTTVIYRLDPIATGTPRDRAPRRFCGAQAARRRTRGWLGAVFRLARSLLEVRSCVGCCFLVRCVNRDPHERCPGQFRL